MKHALKISVSKEPKDGIVAVRNVRVRERLLRALLGCQKKVMVLVPGDSVEEIAISTVKEGGTSDE